MLKKTLAISLLHLNNFHILENHSFRTTICFFHYNFILEKFSVLFYFFCNFFQYLKVPHGSPGVCLVVVCLVRHAVCFYSIGDACSLSFFLFYRPFENKCPPSTRGSKHELCVCYMRSELPH